MTIECVTKDALLQKPKIAMSPPMSGISSSPFMLNGSPITNRPSSLTGIVKYKRKSKASSLSALNGNLDSYFAADNYQQLNVATEHIIGADPQNTLRYENINFTQQFIALHQNVWSADGPLQVSIFFVSADNIMFHMCIPIEFTNSSTDENSFLKWWLYKNPTGNIPTGLTINNLLQFPSKAKDSNKKTTASFQTFNFCLQYNGKLNINPYIFCLFNNTLKINTASVPKWLQTDLTFTSDPDNNRPKRFDDILNLLFRKTYFNSYISGTVDPFLSSEEKHFDAVGTQTAVNPTYYTVKVKALVGTVINDGKQESNDNIRGLKNVKCYPIDLATQIDDEGNVIIDTDTNKPIDLETVSIDKLNTVDPDLAEAALLSQKKSNDWIQYVIASICILLILIAVIIVVIVYIFPGKMFGSAAVLPAPVPAPAQPVAIAPLNTVPVPAPAPPPSV